MTSIRLTLLVLFFLATGLAGCQPAVTESMTGTVALEFGGAGPESPVRVLGQDFPAQTPVLIYLQPVNPALPLQRLDTVRTDREGRFMYEFQLPLDAPASAPASHDVSINRTSNDEWRVIIRLDWTVDESEAPSLAAACSDIPAGECRALVALYEATNGPGWRSQSGWLTATAACTWAGVTCEDGHVVDLGLPQNGLRGPLPPALGGLARLRSLSLDGNRLTGPLPETLFQLRRLSHLSLSRNRLSGPLPLAMGQAASLSYLNLAGNQFSGALPAPPPAASVINLAGNQFSGGLGSAWGRLESLTDLNLAHNRLTGSLPDPIGWSELMSLNLAHNRLEGPILAAYGQLPRLIELNLAHNRLTSAAPLELNRLALVGDLRLEGNQLDGVIPVNEATGSGIHWNGLQLTVPAGLATSVWPEALPALEPVVAPAPWLAVPAQRRLTLANPTAVGSRPAPRLWVYPAAGLASNVVDSLRQLLADQPPTVERGQLSLLPPTNLYPMPRPLQVAYVRFTNGQGLRFVAQPGGQAVTPINNAELLYCFLGLTEDGAWVVAGQFPLTHPDLPAGPRDLPAGYATYDDFAAGQEAYVAALSALLDSAEPTTFNPDLARLDSLLRSLRLGAPATP